MKAKERLLSRIIRGIVKSEEFPWPPVCNGVLYQPERPVTKRTTTPELSSSTKNDSSIHQTE